MNIFVLRLTDSKIIYGYPRYLAGKTIFKAFNYEIILQSKWFAH